MLTWLPDVWCLSFDHSDLTDIGLHKGFRHCVLHLKQYWKVEDSDHTMHTAKAVSLHAMKALGGRGGTAHTHNRPRH
jgi:hypothetical protein